MPGVSPVSFGDSVLEWTLRTTHATVSDSAACDRVIEGTNEREGVDLRAGTERVGFARAARLVASFNSCEVNIWTQPKVHARELKRTASGTYGYS